MAPATVMTVAVAAVPSPILAFSGWATGQRSRGGENTAGLNTGDGFPPTTSTSVLVLSLPSASLLESHPDHLEEISIAWGRTRLTARGFEHIRKRGDWRRRCRC